MRVRGSGSSGHLGEGPPDSAKRHTNRRSQTFLIPPWRLRSVDFRYDFVRGAYAGSISFIHAPSPQPHLAPHPRHALCRTTREHSRS